MLGASGSGKSTLLRAIAGLEAVDGGRVLIDGADQARVAPARRGVAMVFQSFALFPHLSVERNIAFGMRARRESARAHIASSARNPIVGASAALEGRSPAISSPGTGPSSRFIGGVPTKRATHMLAGRSHSSSGVPTCTMRPSCSTATRWPSASASSWSCVT